MNARAKAGGRGGTRERLGKRECKGARALGRAEQLSPKGKGGEKRGRVNGVQSRRQLVVNNVWGREEGILFCIGAEDGWYDVAAPDDTRKKLLILLSCPGNQHGLSVSEGDPGSNPPSAMKLIDCPRTSPSL